MMITLVKEMRGKWGGCDENNVNDDDDYVDHDHDDGVGPLFL